LGERIVGRPLSTMGFEPENSVAAPCDWPGCAASADPSVSLAHSSPESSVSSTKGAKVRAIGLDVHRDFCEVAIAEAGKARSAGRIETRPQVLELFAQSLATDDRVVLEVTGNAWEIARIIEPHVARVIVVSPSDTGIRQARAKTDRAGRADAGQAAGRWIAGQCVDARRADQGDAPSAGAPVPAGGSAHAREERDPRDLGSGA
jgi:hypothetical protein